MSNRRLVVTDLAEEDLRHLLRHTFHTWGEDQRSKYGQMIEETMDQLTLFPDLGRVVRVSSRDEDAVSWAACYLLL